MTYRDSSVCEPPKTASGKAQTCLDGSPDWVLGFGKACRQPRGAAP